MNNNFNKIKKVIKKIVSEALLDKDNRPEELSQGEIQDIIKAYISTALFTDFDNIFSNQNSQRYFDNRGLIKNYNSFVNRYIDADTQLNIYADIKKFIRIAGDEAVNEALNTNKAINLGHDIWLTRNGHGAGFMDNWYEYEDELVKAAKKLGESNIYMGDDGMIYFT